MCFIDSQTTLMPPTRRVTVNKREINIPIMQMELYWQWYFTSQSVHLRHRHGDVLGIFSTYHTYHDVRALQSMMRKDNWRQIVQGSENRKEFNYLAARNLDHTVRLYISGTVH